MKKKPIGITILSILALISGVLIVSQAMHARNFNALLVVSVLFVGILAISSGIGMLLGKRWGWWLGTFYYVYAILRYLNTIFAGFRIAVQSQNSIPEIGNHITEYGIRIVIHSLILLYFFKDDVKEYFNVSHYSKFKPTLALFGIGIAIMGFGTLIVHIL